MLQVGSAPMGYAIEADDGPIGTLKDILFDDRTWKVRWLVIDTGTWLPGRQVLIHPSAVGRLNYLKQTIPVTLTMAQVKAGPDAVQDQPVSRQLENRLYNHYNWDPTWGSSFFGPDAMLPDVAGGEMSVLTQPTDDDPRLRSLSAVTGYHINATDGFIGHLQDVLLEDDDWSIRYLIIDTRNWWPGQHVLISPYAVRRIDWEDEQIVLNIAREMVKSSPPWAPLDLIDQAYEKRLHLHYDWPGYGW